MNLPIDVVVDLLMANTYRFADIVCVHTAEAGQSMTIKADTLDDLRSKVREYLLTLVPKPVLLSECEAGVEVLIAYPAKKVHPMAFCAKTGRNLGLASGYQVIQPVEVQ